jgi:hypothetical protein
MALLTTARDLLKMEGAWENLERLQDWSPAHYTARVERELDLAQLGRCKCDGCGKTVNNAWRDDDGFHCLTCLAKQRDEARAEAARLKAKIERMESGENLIMEAAHKVADEFKAEAARLRGLLSEIVDNEWCVSCEKDCPSETFEARQQLIQRAKDALPLPAIDAYTAKNMSSPKLKGACRHGRPMAEDCNDCWREIHFRERKTWNPRGGGA